MKLRKQPVRTCVSCRTTDEKRDLLRVVRQPDGTVCFDAKGKANGRGAYVCAAEACIAQAERQKRLERSLRASALGADVFIALRQAASSVEPPVDVPATPVIGAEPQNRMMDKENKV